MSKELEKAAIDYGKKNGRNIYSYYNTELDLENAYRDGATSEAAKEFWQVTPSIDPETIEQINIILGFKETSIELAHRQQIIKKLYSHILGQIR